MSDMMMSTKMVIVIVRAEILQSTKKVAKMSTYAIARIGKRQFETNVCKFGGLTPHWDEKFATFFLESERELYIELWEQDYGNHILLADGMLELQDCKDAGTQTLWVKLRLGSKQKGKMLVHIKCEEGEPVPREKDPFDTYVEKKIFKRKQPQNEIMNLEPIQKVSASKPSRGEQPNIKQIHTQSKQIQGEFKVPVSNTGSKTSRTNTNSRVAPNSRLYPLKDISDKKQVLRSATNTPKTSAKRIHDLSVEERSDRFHSNSYLKSRNQSHPIFAKNNYLDSDRYEKRNQNNETVSNSFSMHSPKGMHSQGRSTVNKENYENEKETKNHLLNDSLKQLSFPKLNNREYWSREPETSRSGPRLLRKSDAFGRSGSAQRFAKRNISESYSVRALHQMEDHGESTNYRPVSRSEIYQGSSNLMVIKVFKKGVDELRKQRPPNPLHHLGMYLLEQHHALGRRN